MRMLSKSISGGGEPFRSLEAYKTLMNTGWCGPMMSGNEGLGGWGDGN